MKKLITLIIPCFNEEQTLDILYNELCFILNAMDNYDFEFLFIDDGSGDNTFKKLKNLAQSDGRVKYISFSRNFGKEAAMYAGFCNAKGDYAAVIDADMQDPPYLLPQMINIIETQNFDSVAARRADRSGEPVLRSFCANCFYKIMNKISDTDIVSGARDFRLMNRAMVEAIVAISEKIRFSKGIFGWIGFKTCWLSYDNIERAAGTSKWNFRKLFKYSLDGIINFSDFPLFLAPIFGFFILIFSCIALALCTLLNQNLLKFIPGILLLNSVIQLLCAGITGKYIANIHTEIKKRPHYIIRDTNIEACVLIH